MTDKIRIHGLEIACIVGIRPFERRRAQPVRINLTLELDLSAAGQSGRIAQTVDYSRVAAEVESLLRFRAYKLVEVAAEEISAALFAMHPSIERMTLQIEKPEALRGLARSASCEIERARCPRAPALVPSPGCQSELCLRTHEAELGLLLLDARATLPASESAAQRRIEWLASGHLLADERELMLGVPRELADGRRELLHNPGPERAILFRCVDLAPLTWDLSEGP